MSLNKKLDHIVKFVENLKKENNSENINEVYLALHEPIIRARLVKYLDGRAERPLDAVDNILNRTRRKNVPPEIWMDFLDTIDPPSGNNNLSYHLEKIVEATGDTYSLDAIKNSHPFLKIMFDDLMKQIIGVAKKDYGGGIAGPGELIFLLLGGKKAVKGDIAFNYNGKDVMLELKANTAGITYKDWQKNAFSYFSNACSEVTGDKNHWQNFGTSKDRFLSDSTVSKYLTEGGDFNTFLSILENYLMKAYGEVKKKYPNLEVSKEVSQAISSIKSSVKGDSFNVINYQNAMTKMALNFYINAVDKNNYKVDYIVVINEFARSTYTVGSGSDKFAEARRFSSVNGFVGSTVTDDGPFIKIATSSTSTIIRNITQSGVKKGTNIAQFLVAGNVLEDFSKLSSTEKTQSQIPSDFLDLASNNETRTLVGFMYAYASRNWRSGSSQNIKVSYDKKSVDIMTEVINIILSSYDKKEIQTELKTVASEMNTKLNSLSKNLKFIDQTAPLQIAKQYAFKFLDKIASKDKTNTNFNGFTKMMIKNYALTSRKDQLRNHPNMRRQ